MNNQTQFLSCRTEAPNSKLHGTVFQLARRLRRFPSAFGARIEPQRREEHRGLPSFVFSVLQ